MEYNQQIDADNWAMCEAAYKASNQPTITDHEHGDHRPHRSFEVKRDLTANRCKSNLKDYWIDHL
jgi:hypothetical protein